MILPNIDDYMVNCKSLLLDFCWMTVSLAIIPHLLFLYCCLCLLFVHEVYVFKHSNSEYCFTYYHHLIYLPRLCLLASAFRFLLIVSFRISLAIDLGSSTGTSSVLPRCWLYCKTQPSMWPLIQYSLIESWLSLNQTPSSLCIYKYSNI